MLVCLSFFFKKKKKKLQEDSLLSLFLPSWHHQGQALAPLVEHASFSGENVRPIVFLRLTFALNKGLLDLQPFIRFLVLVMYRSCCCMSRLLNAVRRLSLSPMKLKQGSETPFMDVLPIFLPCNNRFLKIFIYSIFTIHIEYLSLLFFICFSSIPWIIDGTRFSVLDCVSFFIFPFAGKGIVEKEEKSLVFYSH